MPQNHLDIRGAFAANYAKPEVYHVDSDHDGKPEVECPLWQLRYYRMATLLAPVDSREVLRCDHCDLVQFRTANNLCRRCKTSFDEEPEPIITMPVAQPVAVAEPGSRPLSVAGAIRALRTRAGLSQRQLAQRMNVPRTYVSKIENEKACPTLSSMQRLADALNVTVCDLLRNGEPSLEDQIRQLQGDEFIAELIPYLRKLNSVQWTSILNEIRAMTVQPRRTA